MGTRDLNILLRALCVLVVFLLGRLVFRDACEVCVCRDDSDRLYYGIESVLIRVDPLLLPQRGDGFWENISRAVSNFWLRSARLASRTTAKTRKPTAA